MPELDKLFTYLIIATVLTGITAFYAVRSKIPHPAETPTAPAMSQDGTTALQ
jgi:hypothetical protein